MDMSAIINSDLQSRRAAAGESKNIPIIFYDGIDKKGRKEKIINVTCFPLSLVCMYYVRVVSRMLEKALSSPKHYSFHQEQPGE